MKEYVISIIFYALLDDYSAFKADIEACIKFYSKLRGKRSQSAEFLEYFKELMEESFPEDSVEEVVLDETVSKKRGRMSSDSHDVAEDGTDKPDRKRSTVGKVVDTQEVSSGTIISSSQKVFTVIIIY